MHRALKSKKCCYCDMTIKRLSTRCMSYVKHQKAEMEMRYKTVQHSHSKSKGQDRESFREKNVCFAVWPNKKSSHKINFAVCYFMYI